MHTPVMQADSLLVDRAKSVIYRDPSQILDRLSSNPNNPIRACISGALCDVKVVIPGYGANIQHHYADILKGETLGSFSHRVGIPFDFNNFGLEMTFDAPSEIVVHDQELELDNGLRRLGARFGPIILKKAYLPKEVRHKAQRNIFSHLNFHYDRGANQPTQYSLFSRDPFDPVQRAPRESSTVFVANIVCILQCLKEGISLGDGARLRANYEIFKKQATAPLVGDIWLEQAWNEPLGTGEISVLDNRTVMHASYYRDRITKGYPIGVRYLR